MSDEYQSIPVAVARAAVQASGELEGIEGPYYAVGNEPSVSIGSWWRSAFRVTDEAPNPDFAKVVITRKGQKPREVVISWDEYAEQMDAVPEWDALRASKPMSIFGAEVERHAYRVVFADVLAAAMPLRIVGGSAPPADALKNDRMMVLPDSVPAAGWGLPARDWIAEVKAADAVQLNALYDEAREAGALVDIEGLQQAIMDRTLDLAKPKPVPPPRDAQAPAANRRRRGKRP